MQQLENLSVIRCNLSKPERICFLIDTHPEMVSPWDDGRSRLDGLRQAILAIVKRKTNICNRHQFAVASYSASDVAMQCDFTSRISDIEGALGSINIDLITGAEESIDLARVIERAGEKLLHCISDTDYLTRCVVIFGRSKEVPMYSSEPAILKSQRFMVDVLYMHFKSSEIGVRCQEIFDILCELQHENVEDGTNPTKFHYIVETHPSPLKLLPALCAILCHSGQRGELYGDDGFLARIDPSESRLAAIRARCQVNRSSSATAKQPGAASDAINPTVVAADSSRQVMRSPAQTSAGRLPDEGGRDMEKGSSNGASKFSTQSPGAQTAESSAVKKFFTSAGGFLKR